MWRLAAILDFLITETSDQNKNVTIVLSMVEYPHLDILHGHSNQFIWHWLICPNSPQNWAFGTLYRAKWPPWGIFALGNICFHKPGSDRDLWVPLKFCHQWGARGPLLPTRLFIYASHWRLSTIIINSSMAGETILFLYHSHTNLISRAPCETSTKVEV